MSESKLHQKIGLGFFLFFILMGLVNCRTRGNPLQTKSRKVLPQGSIGSFRVEHLGGHLLLHGFSDPTLGKDIPLLFDTGSDITFLAEEEIPNSRELEWQGNRFHFPVKRGILPPGVLGVVGLDFFQQYCIWWEEDLLTVYSWQSAICEKPVAFFSVGLKMLRAKKIGTFYYLHYASQNANHWGLADTGASISILPREFEEGAEFRGKSKLFLAGGKIQEVDLFFTDRDILFSSLEGIPFSMHGFSFFRGISLEHLNLPREKDREDDSVIGLELLARFPVFWDFKRVRIGLFENESNNSEP